MNNSICFYILIIAVAVMMSGCHSSNGTSGADTETEGTDSTVLSTDDITVADTQLDSVSPIDTTEDTVTSSSPDSDSNIDTVSSADSDTKMDTDSSGGDSNTPSADTDSESETTEPIDSATNADTGHDTENDTGNDTGNDTDSDTESDSHATNNETACESNADCVDNRDKTYCLVNLMPNQSGFCTIADCSGGDCQKGHGCCDCTGVTLPDGIQMDLSQPVCVPDTNAISFGALGCDCDNNVDTDNNLQVTRCESDTDCANNGTANHCWSSAVLGAEGVCTQTDCSPGDCQDGYLCCDCGSLGAAVGMTVPMCMTQTIATALGTSCSCN